jgi:type II secretion system protein G
MFSYRKNSKGGFTLIELLVVIAIIGILASIVLMSVGEARKKANDSGRKAQVQEIMKALELYFADNKQYPVVPAGGVFLTNVALQNTFIGTGSGKYLSMVPPEPERYYYCSTGDFYLIAVNTEIDKGVTGSDYCNITRGSGPNFGCTYIGAGSDIDADDTCLERY